MFSADGHGIHDTNIVSSKFQPDRSPVGEGNEEVNSRDDEQKQSKNNSDVVEKVDEEEREEIVVSVNKLIWIPIDSVRTDSINCGQVNSI